jgi:hypothetical protein
VRPLPAQLVFNPGTDVYWFGDSASGRKQVDLQSSTACGLHVTDRLLGDLSRSAAEAIVRRVAPTATVTEVVVRAGGQLSTVYEARCADWPDRLSLYQLYHALELWDWFAAIGDTAPLLSIVEDIRRCRSLLAILRTAGRRLWAL